MVRRSPHIVERCASSFWPLASSLVVLVAASLFGSISIAEDNPELAAVKEIVGEKCKSCHGFDGLAEEESWPNLNCQNRGYLYSRMMHLRSSQDHEIDDTIKALNLSDIGKLAEYYASQPCKKRY